jgi:hypothetical protein
MPLAAPVITATRPGGMTGAPVSFGVIMGFAF